LAAFGCADDTGSATAAVAAAGSAGVGAGGGAAGGGDTGLRDGSNGHERHDSAAFASLTRDSTELVTLAEAYSSGNHRAAKDLPLKNARKKNTEVTRVALHRARAKAFNGKKLVAHADGIINHLDGVDAILRCVVADTNTVTHQWKGIANSFFGERCDNLSRSCYV
jgi:hypothetical protein